MKPRESKRGYRIFYCWPMDKSEATLPVQENLDKTPSKVPQNISYGKLAVDSTTNI
jgi:hypothetical protein